MYRDIYTGIHILVCTNMQFFTGTYIFIAKRSAIRPLPGHLRNKSVDIFPGSFQDRSGRDWGLEGVTSKPDLL